MSYHMIIRRGSTWHFRRAVPKALRTIIGHREITRSLHTSDLREAKSRAIAVAAEVDALLWRARRTLANPEAATAALAAQIVRQDAEARRGVLMDDDTTEAEQIAIVNDLEKLSEQAPANFSDAVQVQARIKALRVASHSLSTTPLRARMKSPRVSICRAKSVVPALLALLDVPVDEASWQALDPLQRHQQTLDAVKRLLLRESEVQPLVAVFEDLHWIDGETQPCSIASSRAYPRRASSFSSTTAPRMLPSTTRP